MPQPVTLKKLSLMVLWSPTRPSRIHTQKIYPFIYWGLECKSGKSGDTWSNRQIWLWSAEWSRVKAKWVLQRECTGHSKHSLPTTQEKSLHMDITRWPTLKSDWLYSLPQKMKKLYTVSKNKTSDCDSWNLIAKFRLELRKVGKTTRSLGMIIQWKWEIDLRD